MAQILRIECSRNSVCVVPQCCIVASAPIKGTIDENIIAGTLTLILIGLAAAAVFPAWAALTVVALTAISPHLIALAIYLLTETPSAFFVVLLLALCTSGQGADAVPRSTIVLAIGLTKGRSQRAFMSWEKFPSTTDHFFPSIRILHPLPCHRFDARTRGKSPVR
jgi:hypothetical protein